MKARLRTLATGAIGLALAATLSTAVPAAADPSSAARPAAVEECGAGQLCVWMALYLQGYHLVVVTPARLPQCTWVGFGTASMAVGAVNNTASDVVFYEYASNSLCSGRSITVPPGGEVPPGGFDLWVKGVGT